MLTQLKIERLFDTFDYDIQFNQTGITILTGPNGYGKTTILKILDALAGCNLRFLKQLNFASIMFQLNNVDTIVLEKDTLAKEKRLSESVHNGQMPKVYFIPEQRLLQHNKSSNETTSNTIRTIEVYATDLSNLIRNTLAQAAEITQELDGSFPRRLFEEEKSISEEEFTPRFAKVQHIRRALNQYAISDIKEETHPTYKPENARALHVYINDAEEKLKPYEVLLSKLKLFTEILNERRFSFKRIQISKEHGFKFVNDNGTPLALSDLSSGEQQEVVLLYELLFKAPVGSVVLIDEPELSLHVAWQKQFVSDLIEIQKLQKLNIVIATHSPQIVNGRWDLTVDLEVLHRETISG